MLPEGRINTAILQHFKVLPTSLIDITENPFVALQFMSCFKKMWEPQLEIYKIDSNSNGTIDDPHSLVTFVHKTIKNKRIKAQRGAFLRTDSLKIYCLLTVMVGICHQNTSLLSNFECKILI